MKTPFIVVLLLVLLTAGMGHGQQQADNSSLLRIAGNGVWWDSLSAARKSDFVDGYTTAMAAVNTMTHSECMAHAKDVTPGPGYDAQFKEVMNLCLLAEFFDYGTGVQKLSDGLDGFYKDSENTRIPVQFAIQYVRDQLNGKRAPRELSDELADWRKIMDK